MQLTSERLRLRPVTGRDVDDLWALWTDPDVRRYLWDDVVIPRERAAQVVAGSVASMADRGLGLWMLHARDEEGGAAPPLGFAGLIDFIRPPSVELLYGLAPAHWGRGLATEAAAALLRHGFATLGLDRIVAGADPPNVASIRVMERLGMRPAAPASPSGGGTTYYAIDREEWAAP